MKKLLTYASNWKFIVPALIAFIGCIYFFVQAENDLSALAGHDVQMIDTRGAYDLESINDFFEDIGAEGREIHRQTTAITDSIFPFAYGALFILLAAFFLKKIFDPNSNWMYLSLVPVLLMIFDFKENWNTLQILDQYPDLSADQVSSASSVSMIKAMLTNVSMMLPLILGIIWLVKWLINRNRAA